MNVDNFKETAEQITLHGLGFMQIKLPGNQRIHVWHPDIPKRNCFKHSSIHDHRFGFTSTVLVGQQVNQFYRATSIKPFKQFKSFKAMGKEHGGEGFLPTHVGYLHEGERTEYGNRPWIPHIHVVLEKAGPRQTLNPGQSYTVNPYILHATECEGVCVTLMRKSISGDKGAHSFCEILIQPDVDFDRKQMSEFDMWEIFREALRG